MCPYFDEIYVILPICGFITPILSLSWLSWKFETNKKHTGLFECLAIIHKFQTHLMKRINHQELLIVVFKFEHLYSNAFEYLEIIIEVPDIISTPDTKNQGVPRGSSILSSLGGRWTMKFA
jgi:hypothetical protein